ncbi:MAG: lysostaphin resistance A-like protein [Candidatus Hodarchaeales archaeon]
MRKYSSFDLWLRIVLFLSITIMLTFSLQVFIVPLAQQLLNDGERLPATLEINIMRTVNGVVGLGLVWSFLSYDRQKMSSVGFKWNSYFGKEWILIAIPISLAGLIPTVIIESFFDIIVFGDLLDVIGILITLFVTLIPIGIGEEILFRGYIQRMVQTRHSFKAGSLLSAILFGFLHFWLAATSRNIYYMLAIFFSAFVIGLMFSYAFMVTNYNLIFPVAIHGFWDFFLFIFQADFDYRNLLQATMEVFASTIGALIIFLFVYFYAKKREYFRIKADSKNI